MEKNKILHLLTLSNSFNFLPASGDFYCLLISFANCLNPDQDRENLNPDLDPNCLIFKSIALVPVRIFENVNFEKSQQQTTKA